MKRSAPLKRKTGLRRGKTLRPKKSWRKKKSVHNWSKMTEETYANSHGLCEWCGKPVPYGTLPAHIIPRSPTDLTLDEPWNTACMHIGEPRCHGRFDDGRARAVRQMEAEGGCRLLLRIKNHPRLKAHFEILESKLQFMEDMKGTDVV